MLRRIDAAQPVLLAILAPAGFGKTTVIRQFATRFEAVAICDCAGVDSPAELGRRVLRTLSQIDRERAPTLARELLGLGSACGNAPPDLEPTLALWSSSQASGLFVFENAADALISEARTLLYALLAARPAGIVIGICARFEPPVRWTRFAAPHEVLVLRAAELAFSQDEIGEALAGIAVKRAQLAAFERASGGWPIAVLLFARFAREGRLEEMLARLEAADLESIRDYIADEILTDLPADERAVLVALAAIPDAGPDDLTLALGHDGADDVLARALASVPLVHPAPGGGWSVHPLLLGAIARDQEPLRRELLERALAGHDARGNHVRAAMLALRHGDFARAAASLEAEHTLAPTAAYLTTLAQLPQAIIERFPELWYWTAHVRWFTTDDATQLAQAERVYAALDAQTPSWMRCAVALALAGLRSAVGRHEEAASLLAELQAGVDPLPRSDQLPELGLFIDRPRYQALLGEVRSACAELERIRERCTTVAQTTWYWSSSQALVLRLRGERERERAEIARQLATARELGWPGHQARTLVDALTGAWLVGEDDAFAQITEQLAELVERYEVRGLAYLLASARNQPMSPLGIERRSHLLFGHLMRAANAPTAVGVGLLEAAREVADDFRSPFHRLLPRLALFLRAGARPGPALDELLEIAGRLDVDAPRLAIERLARGERATMFDGLIARFGGPSSVAAPAGPRIRLELLEGAVRDAAGLPITTLRGRDYALALAIARRPEGIAREALVDALWPELDGDRARNALNVALHRLRERSGERELVVRSGERFRFGDGVRVDLHEIEANYRRIAATPAPSEVDAHWLDGTIERIVAFRQAAPELGAWFAQTERRLDEIVMRGSLRLVEAALAADDFERVLTLAGRMIAFDAWDEAARSVRIRALLGLGDRVAAVREFEAFAKLVREAFGTEPSPDLAALVGASATHAHRR
ncbi:MAG: BTAD domain-containing putative transcriptional regulator [Vulcanimicrobiaceae bacterium]